MNLLTPKSIAHSWIESFNAKDLDGLVGLYDLHAEHFSPKLRILRPETNGYVRGLEAITDWYADAMERLPNLHYKLIRITDAPDRALIEYIRENPGDPDIRVAEMLEIGGGRIIASRVYHS